MNIGFDAKRAFLNRTGLGNYSRAIIEGMASGFPENKYFLFTPSSKGHFTPPAGACIVEPSRILQGKLSLFWRALMLGKKVVRLNLDIFHGLSSEIPIGLEKSPVKRVVTVHDLIFLRYPELYNPADAYIYKRKTLYACNVSDRIIAISEQTKQDLIEFLRIPEDKIVVLYQDCHSAFHQPVSEEKKRKVREKYFLPSNYLLTVGTIEKRKNHLLILKALQLLEPSVSLVIAGKDGGNKEYLQKYIRVNGLEHRVRFLEYLNFEDLPALYSMASLFVYPSVFEGFGIPILEAMNCSVPVITSEGSCFSETGGNAAAYIDPENQEELADAVKKVLDNVVLRQSMIQKGREQVLNFRKEINIPKLNRLYKETL